MRKTPRKIKMRSVKVMTSDMALMRWTPGDVMSRTASAGVLASWLASFVSLRDMMTVTSNWKCYLEEGERGQVTYPGGMGNF